MLNICIDLPVAGVAVKQIKSSKAASLLMNHPKWIPASKTLNSSCLLILPENKSIQHSI